MAKLAELLLEQGKCHHCEWSGAVNERENHRQRRRRPAVPVKPTARPGDPTPALLQWFAKRGISDATVRRNRVGASHAYIPALRAEVDSIAFPYFHNGELINIKFRALEEKEFVQGKGAPGRSSMGSTTSPTTKARSSWRGSSTSWRSRKYCISRHALRAEPTILIGGQDQ